MSDESIDNEQIENHIIQLGKKRPEIQTKSNNTSKKQSKLKVNEEIMESDSKEYVEEEEEEEEDSSDEGDENNDSIDDDENSQYRKNKKLKLDDNPGPRWERKWLENPKDEHNSMSSSSAIVVDINKGEKNNEVNNSDKMLETKLMNEAPNNFNNLKKANFIITSPESNSNQSQTQEVKAHFNVELPNLGAKPNNDSNNHNKISNNNPINNYNTPKFSIPDNRMYMEAKKNKIMNNNININNINYPNNIPPQNIAKPGQSKIIQVKIPPLLNGPNLCKFMEDKYRKYGINSAKCDHNQIANIIAENLYKYIRCYLTRLITISRIRNVNFHLYSNNPRGQTHYKFKTFNWQLSEDKKNFSFVKAKDLDILFTSNLKKEMDLIEEYVELNNKKIKFEKLSSCKEKDEENDKVKGIESSIKITEGPNPTIKLLPGRRTKKKNNSLFKEVKKKIVQTQKKEDLNKQKSNTKNTLDAFLNDSTTDIKKHKKNPKNVNSFDNESLNSTKLGDNMSGMHSGLNNNNSNQLSNEININVFSSFDPKKNRIISSGQKRRINLKDLIFLLENSTEYIPKKYTYLNKASLEHMKKYLEY